MMLEHIPPYRQVCSHCRRPQAVGHTWYSNGLGKLYCEVCLIKALELLDLTRSATLHYLPGASFTYDNPDHEPNN